MGEVKKFTPKDELDNRRLIEEISDFIGECKHVIVITHDYVKDITDVLTTLNFKDDRIILKGIMSDAGDIIFRASPPKTYEGDVD